MREKFILNIKTGILHIKDCADGNNGNSAVKAGDRKPYSNYNNAIQDRNYVKNHNHPYCLGEENY